MKRLLLLFFLMGNIAFAQVPDYINDPYADTLMKRAYQLIPSDTMVYWKIYPGLGEANKLKLEGTGDYPAGNYVVEVPNLQINYAMQVSSGYYTSIPSFADDGIITVIRWKPAGYVLVSWDSSNGPRFSDSVYIRKLSTTEDATVGGITYSDTLYGGTGSSGTLFLGSTSNATKGKIFLGDYSAFDETNKRLGIGTSTPSNQVHISDTNANPIIRLQGAKVKAAARYPSIYFSDSTNTTMGLFTADLNTGSMYYDYKGTAGSGTGTFNVRNAIGSSAVMTLAANGAASFTSTATVDTIYGSAASGGDLFLSPTSNATKGQIDIGVGPSIVVPPPKTAIADNTDTPIFLVSASNGSYSGGVIEFSVNITDGTDFQTHSGYVYWAIANKAGTRTTNINEQNAAETASANTAGTLADTWTIVAGSSTNPDTIKANFNSSLTPTGITLNYIVKNLSSKTITPL